MTTADYSAIAAAVSAACAFFTLYMFRSRSRGFVWTKDHVLSVLADKECRIHMQARIPLFNLGKGNIKFISLRAKKINIKTKAMENFEIDMDEAYFPEGASIIAYQTPIHTEMAFDEKTKFFISSGGEAPTEQSARKEYQDKINRKLNEIPETILILKYLYKDGSWFGMKTKGTVIGLTVSGSSISYLSTARRKELNEYFAW